MAFDLLEVLEIRNGTKWYHTGFTDSNIFRLEFNADNKISVLGLCAKWDYDASGDRVYWSFKKVYSYDKVQIVNLAWDKQFDRKGGFAFKSIATNRNVIQDIIVERWVFQGEEAVDFDVNQIDLDVNGEVVLQHDLDNANPYVTMGSPTQISYYPIYSVVDRNRIRLNMSGIAPLTGTWKVTAANR